MKFLDCRPGGKYGEKLPEGVVAADAAAPAHDAHLAQAASVLSSVVTEVGINSFRDKYFVQFSFFFFQKLRPVTNDGDNETVSTDAATSLASLSSKMWSELL